jgi:L-amino acid N-acyltransferase YncA
MEQLADRVVEPSAPRPRCRIREATPADVDAVARIYNDSVETPRFAMCQLAAAGLQHAAGASVRSPERGPVLPMSTDAVRHWMAQHGAFARPLWLACLGTRPVGWLSFMGFADRPGMAYTSELAIYVGAEARAAGVGSELLSAALRAAPAMGLDCLIAMAWSNNDASLHLFRRHGFVPWGRMPSAVWAYGASRDMLVLGRHVAAAS